MQIKPMNHRYNYIGGLLRSCRLGSCMLEPTVSRPMWQPAVACCGQKGLDLTCVDAAQGFSMQVPAAMP